MGKKSGILIITAGCMFLGLIAEAKERKLEPLLFARELNERVTRIQEFQTVQELCNRLKVRCWTFGGSTATIAHKFKNDLMRGSESSNEFDEIFRSSQDIDIVIDGSAAKAELLETELRSRYSHMQGNHSAWEVRLLREDRGSKEQLLNNFNIQHQHTDSQSIGLLEITKPPTGESHVRDILDWEGSKTGNSAFTRDILKGRIRYFHSDKHNHTRKAVLGENPDIISVVRYLTKKFQFGLTSYPADKPLIEKVIQDFRARPKVPPGYAATALEFNAQKLLRNAKDVEAAWNELERLGLRKIILDMGNPDLIGSASWWMNKEPLRTGPLGKAGTTAKNLGLDRLVHGTNSLEAYESIMAVEGSVNAFISRGKGGAVAGEAAEFGDGFYAHIADSHFNAATSGSINVDLRIKPNARLGVDFDLKDRSLPARSQENCVIIKNRAAIEVIPQKYELMAPKQYLRAALQGEINDRMDRGILERIRRRVQTKIHDPLVIGRDEILGIFSEKPNLKPYIEFVASLPEKEADPVFRKFITKVITFNPQFPQNLQNDLTMIFHQELGILAKKKHPKFDETFVRTLMLNRDRWSVSIIQNPEWIRNHGPDLFFELLALRIENPLIFLERADMIEYFASHPQYLDRLLQTLERDSPNDLLTLARSERWLKQPGFMSAVERLASNPLHHDHLINNLLMRPSSGIGKAPETLRVLELIIRTDPNVNLDGLFNPYLSKFAGAHKEELKKLCPQIVSVECLSEHFKSGFSFKDRCGGLAKKLLRDTL